jgi:hypothetical protein
MLGKRPSWRTDARRGATATNYPRSFDSQLLCQRVHALFAGEGALASGRRPVPAIILNLIRQEGPWVQ